MTLRARPDELAGTPDCSPVLSFRPTYLRAMGLPVHRTQNSLRFSLGLFSTEAEVDRVLDVIPGVVEKLRSLGRRPSVAAAGRG